MNIKIEKIKKYYLYDNYNYTGCPKTIAYFNKVSQRLIKSLNFFLDDIINIKTFMSKYVQISRSNGFYVVTIELNFRIVIM